MARAGCSVRAPIRDLLASTARQSVSTCRASTSIQRLSTIPSGRSYSTHPSKPPKQGQPLAASHPHLVNSKHLTAGIPGSEYEERRKRLMDSLGEGAVVVCMGNTVRLVTQRRFFSVHFYLTPRHRLTGQRSCKYSCSLVWGAHTESSVTSSGKVCGWKSNIVVRDSRPDHSQLQISTTLPGSMSLMLLSSLVGLSPVIYRDTAELQNPPRPLREGINIRYSSRLVMPTKHCGAVKSAVWKVLYRLSEPTRYVSQPVVRIRAMS